MIDVILYFIGCVISGIGIGYNFGDNKINTIFFLILNILLHIGRFIR